MSAKFLELAKALEVMKEKQSEIREALNAEMATMGIGAHLQDPATGAVYQIVKPNGTFVYHVDLEYLRTALPGERAGTLSKVKAGDLGYTIKKD